MLAYHQSKNELRWELATISNQLNKLLKEAVVRGPRLSTNLKIHELREERDRLMARLNV